MEDRNAYRFEEGLFRMAKFRRLIVWVLGVLAVSLIIMSVSPLNNFYSGFTSSLMIILFLYITPIVWFSSYLHKKGLSLTYLFEGKGHLRKTDVIGSIFMPMFFGLGILILCMGLLFPFLPEVTNTSEFTMNESSIWLFVFNVLTLVLIAPICEEIVFRGYLLGRLSYKYGNTIGIIISSILFGILHLQNVFGAAMFGVIMCVLYIKTSSLKLPVLIHISFNFLVSVRDIYYRYFLDGNSSSEPFPSPVIVIVGGLILISL
ncbi:type II CAAX endopeptidase family protein, partial [Halobacillus sp. HZG1]|uniref:type II CAAX endopeptidase family protein n=1 Tax=Halobacillus sp. HZG1 TaxID=3111769 RepID=UPI002DBF7FB3